MNKLISVVILMFSSFSSFANSDCENQAKEAFSKAHKLHHIKTITYEGVLKAKTDRPYYMGEIWNNSNQDLDIYEVKSSYMAGYTHVVLTNNSCEMISIIEVGFED